MDQKKETIVDCFLLIKFLLMPLSLWNSLYFCIVVVG